MADPYLHVTTINTSVYLVNMKWLATDETYVLPYPALMPIAT